MRILFDQGTPAPLRHALVGHSVETAFQLGWGTLQNEALIAAAEAEDGFGEPGQLRRSGRGVMADRLSEEVT